MLHSTDHFLYKINNVEFKADHKLVSFNVQLQKCFLKHDLALIENSVDAKRLEQWSTQLNLPGKELIP